MKPTLLRLYFYVLTIFDKYSKLFFKEFSEILIKDCVLISRLTIIIIYTQVIVSLPSIRFRLQLTKLGNFL